MSKKVFGPLNTWGIVVYRRMLVTSRITFDITAI